MSWQAITFSAILLVTITLSFFRKWLPKDLYFLIGAAACGISGLVPAKVFYDSAVNDAIITIMALFVIVRALDQSGLFQAIAKHLFGPGWLRFASASVLGAFFPHTLIWLNFQKQLSMPLKLAVGLTLAGVCTIIGSPLNLAVGHLLAKAGSPPAFFDFALIGLPLFLIGMIAICWIREKTENTEGAIIPLGSAWIGKMASMFPIHAREECSRLVEGDLVSIKSNLSEAPGEFLYLERNPQKKHKKLFTSAATLLLFAAYFFMPVSWATSGCALILLAGRVLSLKNALAAVRWDIIIILWSGLVFASAMQAHMPLVSLPLPFLLIAAFFLAHFLPSIFVAVLLFPLIASQSTLPIQLAAMGLIVAATFPLLRLKNIETVLFSSAISPKPTSSVVENLSLIR